SKEVYGAGVNVQDITSLGLSGLHGMTQAQIAAKMKALTFKAAAWGVPYGIFCHPGELTAEEVGNILDGVAAGGGTVITNSQLTAWVRSGASLSGTHYYESDAPGNANNFLPTAGSPVIGAGTVLSGGYN